MMEKKIEHSGRSHAILSPSASHRWMECPPSARLCEQYEDETSVFAQEGTDAHELCQYKVELMLGLDTQNPVENLTYYDQEMERCSDQYAMFVERIGERMSPCEVLVEKQIDFSPWVPEGFGHCDCMIVGETELAIIDYKYGKGVKVDAPWNPQMLCYALGALNSLSEEKRENINMVWTHIFQPRMHSISSWCVSKYELLAWAEEELKPAAELAFAGEGELNAGEHCRFCKAKQDCINYKEYVRTCI